MYQPKVKNIETKFDGQGDRIVVKGKLVLVKQDKLPELGDLVDHGNNGYTIIRDDKHLDFALSFHDDEGYVPVKPVITSIIERPEVGDWIYDREDNIIFKSKKEQDFNSARFLKVLALLEHFSNEHLLDIVDGNREDGDSVLIDCEDRVSKPKGEYFIRLDVKNHITLYNVKQSLEDFIEEYTQNEYYNNGIKAEEVSEKAIRATIKWFKNNGE